MTNSAIKVSSGSQEYPDLGARVEEEETQSPGTSVYRFGLHRRHLGKLHRSACPPVPHFHPCKEIAPDTHMGSRVLLSQDFSASKFSMIILETIHSGPEARQTPQPAQVAAATAAAAPAPSSAHRPRGPRWEAPVVGSREPQ